MLKFCKEQWDKNREKLEETIKTDKNIDRLGYMGLLALAVKVILNDNNDDGDWNADRITEIDDGDYQGTLIFLIPKDCYQPEESEYLMTYVGYGSCSVCDTLQSIQECASDEQKIIEYMQLCEDMIANIVKPYNYGWRYDAEYDVAEMDEELEEKRCYGLNAEDEE